MLANPLGNATAQTTVHCPDFEREWRPHLRHRANEQLHYDIANNGERFRDEVWEANPELVSPPDGVGRASIHSFLLGRKVMEMHRESVNEMLEREFPGKRVTTRMPDTSRILPNGRLSVQNANNSPSQIGIMRIERIVE